jgi:uncharacterized protein (TIGR02217 family)
MKNLFLDISFPVSLCNFYASSIEFFTNVQIAKNGFESRFILSDFGRRKFKLEEEIFSPEKVLEILTFFQLAKGRGFSFRFLDKLDFQGKNENLTEAEGVFYLTKSYQIQGKELKRLITKPQNGKVEIFSSGEKLTEGKDFKVDYLTGKIVFFNHFLDVKTYFDFDVEVRFENDEILVEQDKSGNLTLKNLILTEVL